MKRPFYYALLFILLFSALSYSQEANQPAPRPKRIRISQITLEKYIVEKPLPEYPKAARKKKVQGSVRMHVVLTTSGEIQTLEVMDGDPLLAEAALNGVRRWKFKPYLLNGDPVEVDSQITVEFKLSKNSNPS